MAQRPSRGTVFGLSHSRFRTGDSLAQDRRALYASQSGTAEGLARKVTKELKAKGHIASLISLEGYTPAALAAGRYAVIITSTYGEGEAPEAVKPFYEQLCLEHFPRYGDLSYSVLALGDSNYEQFCKFGVDLDQKLAALGGVRLCDRIDCDLDLDEPFSRWKSTLLTRLTEIVTARPASSTSTAVSSTPSPAASTNSLAHTRTNPYFAQIVDKRPLTH